MKTLITLFAIFALTLTAATQPPDTLWTRTFGGYTGDYGQSVQQTADGGYIIAGWTDPYSADSADVYLIKTDAVGDTIWTRTFGGSGGDYGYNVQQTADGGYIIAGWTYSYGAGESDVYLIKTDIAGNLVWQRTFGRNHTDKGYSVQQTTDGGFIILGYTYSYGAGESDVYLINTDNEGHQIWQSTFGGEDNEFGYYVQQTSDGGYILTGTTYSLGAGHSDIYLIKTDDLGNLVWQHTFGGSNWDDGRSVQQTSDGGYIIAGTTDSYGAGYLDVYLIKTDASGNQTWQRTFGGSSGDYGLDVRQTADGGYIITGFTYSYGAGSADIYLIKTDTSGNQTWQSVFGGFEYDYGWSVQQTSDGGYVVAGGTWSFGAGFFDVYLIKTDAGGGVLSVTTTPVNPPITIPANGGNFQYNCNLHNWSNAPQTASLWNKVRNSAGQYTQVFGPITRTLPGGANPSRVMTQTIAGSISPGTLYFISYIGTYPSIIQDSSFFTILKTSMEDGGPWISESGVTGDIFDEFVENDVGATSALGGSPLQPQAFTLHGAFPNPFNPTTTFRFTLPQAAQVTLEVFDINGKCVSGSGTTPTTGFFPAGEQNIVFDGSDLPSGVYLYRLTAGELAVVGKLILLK